VENNPLANKIKKEEVKMFKKSFAYQLSLVLIVMACLCLALSGCASGAKLTYKASGTATQAEVEYRDEKGQLAKETVSLPWEKTVSIGSQFSFQVNVTNTTDSGTVICSVLLGNKEMGPTTGVTYARCTGNVSKQGSSTKWDFHGEYDKPKAAQAPSPTPPKASPAQSPTRTVAPTRAATATSLASSHTVMGIQYYKDGKLDQAIAEFKKAIELDPTDPANYRNLGTVYLTQGKLSESVAAYEQAIKLNPKFGEAYGDLAGAYASLARYSEAIAAGKKSIELAPKYVTAYNNLGLTYYKQGMLDEAFSIYLEGTKVDANFALLHSNQAIAEFEAYLRLNPQASNKASVEKDIASMKEVMAMATQQIRHSTGGYSVVAPKTWFKVEKSDLLTFSNDQKALAMPQETALKESPLVIFAARSKADAAKSLGLKESAEAAEFLAGVAKAEKMTWGVIQTTKVNNVPVAIADVSGALKGTSFKGSMVFILAGDQVVYGVAMAPTAQWPTYVPVFRIMLMSLSAK
jgi:tetratricopeptide (TPR) repeat protein